MLLGAANLLIEWLEGRGTIETHRPDDFVQFVDEALFVGDGSTVRTTGYAERRVRPAEFSQTRGEQTRLFLLGGSFLMDKPGGIGDWLRESLPLRHPELDARIVSG